MKAEDLKLVETETLMNEICSRFACTSIIVKKVDNHGRELTFRKFHGHPDINIGMCFEMIDHITNEKKRRATPIDMKES